MSACREPPRLLDRTHEGCADVSKVPSPSASFSISALSGANCRRRSRRCSGGPGAPPRRIGCRGRVELSSAGTNGQVESPRRGRWNDRGGCAPRRVKADPSMTIFRPWRDVPRWTGREASRDDLAGVDDLVAELALARRALLRHVADSPSPRCERRFTHPRRPTAFNALGYLVTVTCACLRPAGHDCGCWCEHGFERLVYRVDYDGREHYATRPLGGM